MPPGRITIVGLGPGGLDRLVGVARDAVLDPDATVVVRTLGHPAASELAAERNVVPCDDLYDAAVDFDELYDAIADRVLGRAASADVVYAVPGSAVVGERSVAMIRQQAPERGLSITLHAGESFLDLVWIYARCDPIAEGAQVLDGRRLPDPLQLHLPTVVTQVDRPEVLVDVAVALGRTLPDDTEVTVLDRLGDADELVETMPLRELAGFDCGPRTSLFLRPPATGWFGLVTTNRLLRSECPWDREQTHRSLVPHVIEETYELVDAVDKLGAEAPGGAPDFGAYAEVEEELGDLLLQVVFHATLAQEPGAFGIEEVAEGIRRKLVARHPHVFGDVVAHDAGTVRANWEQLKHDEKARASLMDDVPRAMPALSRADKLQRRAAAVGFDWPEIAPVVAKLVEEVEELKRDLDDREAATHELGDVLFSVVNLARHLGIDAELAFRRANDRFAERFRTVERLAVEAGSDLAAMSLEELDSLWERAKRGGRAAR